MPLLLALVLLVPLTGRAQAPVALNGPIAGAHAAALPDAALFPAARGDSVTPDTTSPRRYFPLHVGNVWEYHDFVQGLDYVLWVAAEEFHGGRRYALVRYGSYIPPSSTALTEAGGSVRLRFDTTTARVYEYNEGNEVLWEPCPFDASWGAAINCFPYPYGPPSVSGGYDRALVFPDGEPPDTLVTAVKTYDFTHSGWYEIRSYAAGVGLLYHEDEFREWGLYYARIDGVEYGRPRHPVSTESGPNDADGTLVLSVWPNPAAGVASLVLTLPEASASVRVALYDGLGRAVAVVHEGPLGAGAHRLAVDASALAPGLYVARALTVRGTVTARLVVVR